MADEPVIDLGVLGPVPKQVAGDRRRWPRLRRRATLGWSTAVLVVALMTGSESQPGHGVSVPAPVSGRFEVVGDLLFVAVGHSQVADAQDPERILSRFDWVAHDLSTGEPLWTLRGVGESLSLVAADGLLWDSGFALDPATGQWLSPEGSSVRGGYRYLGVPGGETLVVSGGYRPYSDSTVDAEFTYQVMGVDAETGVVRWRDNPDPGVRVWLAGDPPRVVTISSDELVSVRDPDTGEVLASRRIPSATSAELIGDRLLVRVWGPDGEVLRGYEPETMTQLWELPEPDDYMDHCGLMLCVHTAPGTIELIFEGMSGDVWEVPRTTELIDPATGQPAWATARRLYPVGDRFLAYDDEGALREIVDAHTGRPLRDLTGWQAVVPPIGYGYPAAQAGAELRSVTLMRTDPAGGAGVARLDPATGELTDLGRLPARPVRCQPYPDGVVCLHADRIWVWPL